MIYYILISVIVYVVLIAVIVVMAFFLKRKNTKLVGQYNNSIIQNEILLNKINNMTKEQKKAVNDEIEKADNINAIADIFSRL
jgi:F0F1-type ATP synthase membrane subunit a